MSLVYQEYVKLRDDPNWKILSEDSEVTSRGLCYRKTTTKLVQSNSFGEERVVLHYDAPRPVDQHLSISQNCEPASTVVERPVGRSKPTRKF